MQKKLCCGSSAQSLRKWPEHFECSSNEEKQNNRKMSLTTQKKPCKRKWNLHEKRSLLYILKHFTLDLLLNVFFVKKFFFNSLPTILGLNKSGGWEAKLSLITDSKDLVLHPNTLPGILYRWMALGSRGEGEGGYARFRIIRMIEGFLGF